MNKTIDDALGDTKSKYKLKETRSRNGSDFNDLAKRDKQYLNKFNKDMRKTIERIEQKYSPKRFEPL